MEENYAVDQTQDIDALVNEMEQYSIPDLELICQTQKELYSKEEMQIIHDILEKKKAEFKLIPDEFNFLLTLFCIVGILTPISGLVVGIIMLINNSKKWKIIGKKTLFAVLISIIIRVFLSNGGFHA